MNTTFENHRNYPLLIHRFENAWSVWFKRSRSFILLEEPAFYVLQLVMEEKEPSAIKKICHERYRHPTSDINSFVDETIQIIKKLNQPEYGSRLSKKKEAGTVVEPASFKFGKNYRFGKMVIAIDYQDEWMQYLVHPSFSHLERGPLSDCKHRISCFRSGGILIVTHNNKLVEAFDCKDTEYYKGTISQLIYSIIYKKPFSGWMSTLHASGVHHNKKAIIFSAAAGSGKSTVSAILKAHGFGFISDDFIAATPDGYVYPFPSSISVKEGSNVVLSGYFPELGKKVQEKAANGKMVRYIPVNNYSTETKDGLPVKGFVFVNYQPDSGYNFTSVGKKEALQLLLKETWVNPKPQFVSAFFDWVEKIPFYRLTYSNNEKMVSGIKNLLCYEG